MTRRVRFWWRGGTCPHKTAWSRSCANDCPRLILWQQASRVNNIELNNTPLWPPIVGEGEHHFTLWMTLIAQTKREVKLQPCRQSLKTSGPGPKSVLSVANVVFVWTYALRLIKYTILDGPGSLVVLSKGSHERSLNLHYTWTKFQFSSSFGIMHCKILVRIWQTYRRLRNF